MCRHLIGQNFKGNEGDHMTNAAKENLADYYGTYRGFAPIEYPPIDMGELEISITKDFVKTRMATGQEVLEGKFPTALVTPMNKKDLEGILDPANPYINRIVGFDAGGVKFLFLPDPSDDEFGLILRYGDKMVDLLLGPSVLYNGGQIVKGLYSKALGNLEVQFGKNCFPTLANAGKVLLSS